MAGFSTLVRHVRALVQHRLQRGRLGPNYSFKRTAVTSALLSCGSGSRRLTQALGAMRHALQVSFCVVVASVPHLATADAPLPPPAAFSVCSKSHSYCAYSDPALNKTVVRASDSSSVLWELPGWHRHPFVSDSGEALVLGYEGANLVPIEASGQEQMLRFYVKGALVRTVVLSEWFTDPSIIPLTVSHRSWGQFVGFTDPTHFAVRLYDGRELSYDALSGTAQHPNGT